MKALNTTIIYLNKKPLLKKLIFVICFSLPLLIVFEPYITQPKTIMTYDWDYFSQMYEAFRLSVLKYGQFPWFNPWVAGGVPLYANPQFGLISIQAVFVLIFGTLLGLKLSVVIYTLFGLWGMYALLRYNESSIIKSLLLGYIFAFGGFGIYHLTGGHLTFATYYLIPFLLLSFQRMLKENRWIGFALFFSFCLLTASHYIMLQFILLFAGIVLLSFWKNPYIESRKKQGTLYLKSFGLIFILTIHKIFYSYQYLKSYPRIGDDFNPVSIITLIKSLIIPPSPSFHIQPAGLNYSWGEYSAYSGIFFLIGLGLSIYLLIRSKKLLNQKIILVIVITLGSLLLAMGDFGKLSPFNIIHQLPIYSSMIAPARWMGWVFLGTVILIGLIKTGGSNEKFLVIILFFSVVEITIFNIPYIKYMNPKIEYTDYNRIDKNYEQYDDFGLNESMRYFRGTRAHYGEVRGYEAIVGYDLYRPTNRCGINKGCGFIITNNARVEFWSPNKIIVGRTGPGDIKLNINPGQYWLVNGKRLWPNDKVVVLSKDFILNDNQDKYELIVSPSLSLGSR